MDELDPGRDSPASLLKVLELVRSDQPVPESLLREAASDLTAGAPADLLAALRRADAARRASHGITADGLVPPERSPGLPQYDIVCPIGAGGQGSVYQARRVDDGSVVAIKFLHATDAAIHERYEREAAIHGRLEHPNIVRVIASGVAVDGTRYLVMPYIDGEPLRAAQLCRDWPEDRRLRLFVTVCRAVQAAHRQGIVHRDLKPTNIRIDKAGKPHVLDFGIATDNSAADLASSLRVTGQPLGTFMWSSYEQVRGERNITPASDVYSLGIILHQLLAGGQFPGQVLEAMRMALEPVLDAGQRGSRHPGAATTLRADHRAIIDRCLQLDPAKRFGSAGELADAVEKTIGSSMPNTTRRRMVLYSALALGMTAPLVPWILSGRVEIYRHDESINGRRLMRLLDSTFAWIPPGDFQMGDPPAEDRFPDERLRQVSVGKGFYIQLTEVRQSQFEDVMGFNPSSAKGDPRPDAPVNTVSYAEALEFCRRASERTKRTVRLPTEIEWEYACRAGTTTRYFWGDERAAFLRYGNIADLATAGEHAVGAFMNWNDGCANIANCGRFSPNRWLLRDMLGNVWEWCQSPYLPDPTDPTTAEPALATLRGGSWWDTPDAARCGHRNPQKLTLKENTVGFRIVVEDE